jgi:hypothetical protein
VHMKHLATLLLLITSAAVAQTPEQAQQRDAQKDLYQRSTVHEASVLNTLNEAGTSLAAQNVGLLDNGHAMVRAFDIANAQAQEQRDIAALQNADAAKQIEYASGVTQLITVHNAACHGEVAQNVYDWCTNVDSPRIQPSIKSANEWGARVNAWKVKVDEAAAKATANNKVVFDAEGDLQKRSDAFVAEVKRYINSYNGSIQRIQDWSDRLNTLKDEFDSCKRSLDSHETLEKIHEVCGSKFDGNENQKSETNYRVPNPTFVVWKGPAFCSENGKYCIEPAQVPEFMVLH